MQQIDKGGHGDEDEPEPDEQEDLLVEEVDGQDALDRVAMNVGLLTDLEIAQRHAWEALRERPVKGGGSGRRLEQFAGHRQSVDVVLRAHPEKRVEKENLQTFLHSNSLKFIVILI